MSAQALIVSTPLCLYLIRHGETEWSLSGQHTGRTDLPVIAQGEHDARELGKALKSTSFDSVFTSPLQRAQRTCELVDLGPPVRLEADLAEWDYGDYEGRTTADIHLDDADWDLYRDGCPRGEVPAQILARADRLLSRIRALSGNVALFSHGHFSAVLAARWLGLPIAYARHFPLGTSAFSRLGYAIHHPGVPVIHQWNVMLRDEIVRAAQGAC